jgi:hypothetical protein
MGFSILGSFILVQNVLVCGGVLLVIGYLFWKRGTDSSSKARWQ